MLIPSSCFLQGFRLAACVLLGSAAVAAAQDAPTAYRPLTFQVGVGFSFVQTDNGQPVQPGTVQPFEEGFSLYADADLHQRLGLEVNLNFDDYITPQDLGQKSFMAGPRLILVHQEFAGRRDFFSVYGKFLGGFGVFEHQPNTASASSQTYGAIGFGGGIELHATPRINVRAIDLEWQRWSGFGANGLTPLVVTLGAAYKF